MRIVFPGMAQAAFLIAIAAAPSAVADCGLLPKAPEMPQGASASEEDMRAGRDALQKYVNALAQFEKCKDQMAKDAPPDTKPEVKQKWLIEAQAANEAAHEIADVYSIQLRAFKARQQQ